MKGFKKLILMHLFKHIRKKKILAKLMTCEAGITSWLGVYLHFIEVNKESFLSWISVGTFLLVPMRGLVWSF